MMESERRHKEQISVLTQVLEAIQEKKRDEMPLVDVMDTSTRVSTRHEFIEIPAILRFEDKQYTRVTHPKLFGVLDWLNANRKDAMIGVRKIGVFTGASKSYVSVTRRYWLSKQRSVTNEDRQKTMA